MSGRPPLPCPALLLSLLALLILAGPTRAHRLEAEYRVLPGSKVQVESWFDLTGESPAGATVTVYRPGGEVLTKGALDANGVLVFSYAQAEPLRVVVSAGAGHRKELLIPARDLTVNNTAAPDSVGTSTTAPASSTSGGAPLADRSSRVSVKDVLLGLSLLLAVAAFALAWGNARKLRELKSSGQRPSGSNF